ncbi:GNAT family N-acetyltransferase [Acaryochloris marina NIES-2412]|uniref:GNAT family N-acetyltransferase n=1 Tax=Acaryochloris marina TaxID=155978 RepID=UPI00405828FB
MKSKILDWRDPLWSGTLKNLTHDIYHLPEYLYCEAKRTQSIPEAFLFMDEGEVCLIPYLLRPCNPIPKESHKNDQVYDITSPNGYSGFLLSKAAHENPSFLNEAWRQFHLTLSSRKICSAFLRLHPILNTVNLQGINDISFKKVGETVSINLELSESELWSHTHKSQRNKINRCQRLGLIAKVKPFSEYINDFCDIYEATMQRVQAETSFLTFNRSYFNLLLEQLDHKLFVCIVEYQEKIIAAGLYSECSGIVQGLLGGTTIEGLKLSPTSLEFYQISLWAKQRGNHILHLGGGVGCAEDSLYHYKANFSKQRHSFYTASTIINPIKYKQLLESHAKVHNVDINSLLSTSFFPAYRYIPNY